MRELEFYRGAIISESLEEGYEADIKGYVFTAPTYELMLEKVDEALDEYDFDDNVDVDNSDDSITVVGDEDDGAYEYAVVFYFGDSDELDDDMDETNKEEITVFADDIEDAYRYAQQYARKKSSEDEKWYDCEILSIDRR